MTIIRARVLGFCMGVRRAVELTKLQAKKAAEEGSAVYTLGHLIHNPQVLADLEKQGVITLKQNSFEQIQGKGRGKNSCVIIRAHGISPETEKTLHCTGCNIIDATCPNVKRNQLKTQELSRAGYSLFLAGDYSHAEIEGITGYASFAPFCKAVIGADQARDAACTLYQTNSNAKTALIGQTTISEEEYSNIGNEIKKYFPNLEIINTICSATAERQQALRELLTKVDAIIIAGGKESANTRRLLLIAQESGKPCALVEKVEEIPENFYSYSTVGIAAGASTPDLLIEEIELALINGEWGVGSGEWGYCL
ncbi:4-hydroxy-3-methylbut-2-enyl diphosphate reductase [Treponema sp. R80B11-R83G3]